jgi:hypothetical protein
MRPPSRFRIARTVVVFGCLIGLGLARDIVRTQGACPPTDGQISGFVLDGATGKPVFDATVTLSMAGKLVAGSGVTSRELFQDIPPVCRRVVAYTPASGVFTFRKVLAGHYSLAVRKPGYPASY